MSVQPQYRILLLDPDKTYRDCLEKVLARNYETCPMGQGQEALEKLDRCTPDVIILETDLSDMDGMKFAHTVRRNPRHKHVPLIFLSRKDSEADQRMGYMVGAAIYLSKQTAFERVAMNLEAFLRDKKVPVRRKYLNIERVRQECREDKEPKAAVSAQPQPQNPPLQPQQRPAPPSPLPSATERNPVNAVSPPVTPAKPANSPAAVQPKIPSPQDKPERIRLLMGESDHKIVFTIQQGLQTCFDCISADSGFEVVEKARRYLPDLLIINIRLPGISLTEVVEALRKSPQFLTLPILGIVKGTEKPSGNAEKSLGLHQVYLMPAEVEQMAYKVRMIVNDPAFVQHRYPQTFQQVWAEEEQKRLSYKEPVDVQAGQEKRNKAFREFLWETKQK